ncbi:DUF4232 domain-containing protein [Actinacidiphila paucisporea]|uniref:DUF4232 domain-containing protein n=1 Tax=Actinacidiphila paucisporea TaxID=310782 RepID=A0A1M6YNC1_9ACTN|nr:DUF4232 domain-containing protein [Actinacidiphila paucisporea]SHL19585.1 Protein of unknown function [Actinacidiphila paucisporea]
MGTRTIGRTVPALLLVTAGLALAACGPSDSSGAAPVASTSSSPTAAATATSEPPSATDTPAPGATTTTPPTEHPATTGGTGGGSAGGIQPACATAKLKTTVESEGGAAGSALYTLVFQNTGSAPCTLRGYPGVSFVKAHNAQLGKAAARTPAATPVVTLIPNAHAYVDLRTVNGQGGYDASQCGLATVPTLRIYPPNQTESTNIAWNKQECVASGIQNLQVGPVHTNR